MEAGKVALAKFSNMEAIKHFYYVVRTIGEDLNSQSQKSSALEGLGDAYFANSIFSQAMIIFEELAKNAQTDVLRLRALRKAMEASFQYGDTDHLMELVNEAEPFAAADRLEYARVLLNKGRAFANRNILVSAFENHAAALRIFEEDYSLWDVALALIGVGVYRVRLGKPREGLAESLRSIAMFEELGDINWLIGAYSIAGRSFGNCLLDPEELNMYSKIIELEEKSKLGNYLRLVYAYAFSSQAFERMGDFEKALSCALKTLEISEKTDSLVVQGIVYFALTVIYTKLGDSKRSEEYFEKLKKLPPDILLHQLVNGVIAKAVFSAGKNQWKYSDKYFNECFDLLKVSSQPEFESRLKLFYAWALERQGRFDEAKIQLEERRQAYCQSEEMFAHLNLQASLLSPLKVKVGRNI